MSGLSGRIALVTGASQGIGRACALELAKAGATVALAARNVEKLEAVAAEIAAEIPSSPGGRPDRPTSTLGTTPDHRGAERLGGAETCKVA